MVEERGALKSGVPHRIENLRDHLLGHFCLGASTLRHLRVTGDGPSRPGLRAGRTSLRPVSTPVPRVA